MIALSRVADEGEAWLGVIPLGIGLAYLLYGAIEGRKLAAAMEKAETRPSPRG